MGDVRVAGPRHIPHGEALTGKTRTADRIPVTTPLVTGWSSPRRDIEPPTRPPQKTSLPHTQRNCLEIERL